MRSADQGLARMDAPMGSFIAYSTAPGATAADGTGKNSPYTLALTKAIQKPGIPIEEAFRDARVEVIAATQKEQIPWESSSLTGAFSFSPGARSTETAAAVAPAPAPEPAASASTARTPTTPPAKITMCKDCPEMVSIPAGSFTMGSPSGEDDRQANEGPQKKISIRGFSMGKYPVTRGQFAEFIQQTGYQPARQCYSELSGGKWGNTSKAHWMSPGFSQTDKDPVVCVSWTDAVAYVQWLSKATGKPYRLPSESEWEYAARAGTTGSHYWGDDADDACKYANAGDLAAKKKYSNWKVVDCDDGYAYTSPVGKFQPNKFGLYDMLGNVKQMVAGCLTPTLDPVPSDGSVGDENCDEHPLRGSSWESIPSVMRSASRQSDLSDEAGFHYGFRVALGQ
jgi:formylglycine-generating enzyme required for sulfatase activity